MQFLCTILAMCLLLMLVVKEVNVGFCLCSLQVETIFSGQKYLIECSINNKKHGFYGKCGKCTSAGGVIPYIGCNL